jgi:hypothetical protein
MNIAPKYYGLIGVMMLSLTANAFAVSPKAGLALLDSLERGSWLMRPTGNDEPPIRICLTKSEDLVQIRHNGVACEQYVVRSTANSVSVSYTCKGQGQGLTTIRKESSRIIHIQSQGIRNNAPFSFSAEGRKTGGC